MCVCVRACVRAHMRVRSSTVVSLLESVTDECMDTNRLIVDVAFRVIGGIR